MQVLNSNIVRTTNTLYPDKGIFIGPNPVSLRSGEVFFRIITNSPADMKIFIYDAVGNLIFDTMKSSPTGKLDMNWNLLTRHKRRVGFGTYLIIVKVQFRNGLKEILKAKLGIKP